MAAFFSHGAGADISFSSALIDGSRFECATCMAGNVGKEVNSKPGGVRMPDHRSRFMDVPAQAI